MAGSISMQAVVEAWLAELTENVDGLATATKYATAPWNPELAALQNNARQVAIYPAANRAQESHDQWTTSHELAMEFHALIWESAGDAQSRLVADSAADFEFFSVVEEARDRFYVEANRNKAGAQNTEFRTVELSDGSGTVRLADITFEVRTVASFI